MKTKPAPADKSKKPTAKSPPASTSGGTAISAPNAGRSARTPSIVKAAAKKPSPPMTKAESSPKAKKETEVDAATVVRRTYTRKKKSEPEVPAILLEGDAPSPAAGGGPGEKFSLGAVPPEQKFSGGELPESYGTKKLFLTARDPHWLYAHWDLTRKQQNELNADSSDGHLILRIFAGKIEAHPA